MGRSKAHNFTNDVGRSKAHNQWQTLYKFNYCTMADTTSLWKIKSSGQAKLLNHWNLKLCLHNYLKKMSVFHIVLLMKSKYSVCKSLTANHCEHRGTVF
jgi:hypothetical protein